MLPFNSKLSFTVLLIFVNHKMYSWEQTCGPRISARLLLGIPCDMQKTMFCTTPGTLYPWTSIRRYIYENQGVIKRMYGNERHSAVLQLELKRRSYEPMTSNRKRTGRLLTVPAPVTITQGSNDILPPTEPTDSPEIPQQTTNETMTAWSMLNTTEQMSTITEPDNDDVMTFSETSHSETGRTEVTTIPLTTTTTESVPEHDKGLYYHAEQETHAMASNTLEEVKMEEKPVKPIRKGINACPVKEEVIAPYWANNTRGETLALLNVYPFEQYVHWEKCAYENHQMLCREGCRCEQQFRLHRLLAFDPKNECRGVFAEWFRFPSCCVCVCYNHVESLFT